MRHRTRFGTEFAVMVVLVFGLIGGALSLPLLGEAADNAGLTGGTTDTIDTRDSGLTDPAAPNGNGSTNPDPNNIGGADPTQTPAPVPGCEGRGTGDFGGLQTLTHNGIERSYFVALPTTGNLDVPQPLLVSVHGYTGTIDGHRAVTNFENVATNAIVVTPKSHGDLWNSGGHPDMADDVDFLATMLDQVEANLCVDPNNIHIAGFSNGAAMASAATCALDGTFASAFLISGANLHTGCESGTALNITIVHGRADSIVGYNGEALATDWASGETALALANRWAQHNGCDTNVERITNAGHTIDIHTNCDNNTTVKFVSVDQIGHSWMGSPWYVNQGQAEPTGLHNYDATDAIANHIDSAVDNNADSGTSQQDGGRRSPGLSALAV